MQPRQFGRVLFFLLVDPLAHDNSAHAVHINTQYTRAFHRQPQRARFYNKNKKPSCNFLSLEAQIAVVLILVVPFILHKQPFPIPYGAPSSSLLLVLQIMLEAACGTFVLLSLPDTAMAGTFSGQLLRRI